jgi:hypothetical protein
LSSFIDYIKWPILKGVIIGAACGISSAACPAILAINRIKGLVDIVSKIYVAISSGKDKKVDEAKSAILSTIISDTVTNGTEGDIRSLSNKMGDEMSNIALNSLGSHDHHIQTIASETTYYAINGGLDGFVSWVIE